MFQDSKNYYDVCCILDQLNFPDSLQGQPDVEDTSVIQTSSPNGLMIIKNNFLHEHFY